MSQSTLTLFLFFARCRRQRRERWDRGPPQGRADLRVPRRPGDVGHAGPGDRRGAHRAGAPPEAGAAVLDAVVLALAAVASRGGEGAVSCARVGVAPFGT